MMIDYIEDGTIMPLVNKIELRHPSHDNQTVYDLIEASLLYFRGNSRNYLTIDSQIASKYIGDFYGLWRYLKIATSLYYTTLRLNNLKCAQDYRGDFTLTIVPNEDDVMKILEVHRTVTE